ncbi:MAG TPA: NlpC/P60 family protein [Egibacteraceae bacterium]|nr:NlpC/P60 family protein [Egibacteraceae bacterium]
MPIFARRPSLTTTPLVRLLAVLALAGALLALPGPALGQSSPEDVRRAEQRLHEMERDFQLVAEDYNAAREELLELGGQIEAARAQVARIETGMAGSRQAARTLARSLYQGGAVAQLETLLSAQGLAEVGDRVGYLAVSRRSHGAVLERFAASRTILDRRLTGLAEARAQAERTEQRMRRLQASVERTLSGQRGELAALRAAVDRAERARVAREQQAARAQEPRRAAQPQQQPPRAAPAREPTPATASTAVASPAPSSRARTAVRAALSQVGKPYRWGAAGPDAYDCSGLSQWAWRQAGVHLPHNSRMQFAATARVARQDWQPGDLLFFGSPIHHLGIYIGDGQMVEAPYSGNQVRVRSAYRSDYAGAGRPR